MVSSKLGCIPRRHGPTVAECPETIGGGCRRRHGCHDVCLFLQLPQRFISLRVPPVVQLGYARALVCIGEQVAIGCSQRGAIGWHALVRIARGNAPKKLT